MGEEILAIVNENDEVIGTAARSEVEEKGLLYRCSGVYPMLNGKFVLQKRSATKKIRPQHWSMVEETVKSGETYEEAARRGVREEMGLEVFELKDAGKITIRDEEYNDNFILKIFIAKCKGKIKIDKKEVAQAKQVSVREAEELAKTSQKISLGFHNTIAMARSSLK
ncbi:MAG: NUDIX domain-containing protein [archaeon]|nr:NUDIX domain-containing protein [archaeon]